MLNVFILTNLVITHIIYRNSDKYLFLFQKKKQQTNNKKKQNNNNKKKLKRKD
jgi:hypothetical protein